MSSKKCSYCDATPKPKVSLAEQDWMAVVINIGKGANHKRLHRRACQSHHGKLKRDMDEFMKDSVLGGGR